MATFDEIRALFRQPADSASVLAFLAACADREDYRPDARTHHIGSKSGGFELLFSRAPEKKPKPAKTKAKPAKAKPVPKADKARTLRTVILHSAGHEEHSQFAGPPAGLTFTTREDLRAALGAPKRVYSACDRWKRDDLHWTVHYTGNGAVRFAVISIDG